MFLFFGETWDRLGGLRFLGLGCSICVWGLPDRFRFWALGLRDFLTWVLRFTLDSNSEVQV